MKKNTLHKVMATALVGAMAMGTLTGCGGSTDAGADASTKDTAAVSTAASTDAGTAAVAGIDGWEPFASNVTLQIPVYDRGMIRSVIRLSARCVGICLSVLFGNIVMVYHGIHISRTDQKAEPWLS